MPETLRSYLGWALVFLIAIPLVQVQSLAREMIDPDEGTFLLMAQDVLRGHLPYTVQFDNKPPGLFLTLAGTIKLFGHSLLVGRATGWAWLFACAMTTFATTRYLAGSLAAGLAVMLMIVCTAMPYGFHLNTEFPALAFVMLALWAILRHRETLWGAALCGLGVSLSVLMRTNLAYVAVALGVVYVAGALWPRLGFPRTAVVAHALGGIVPPALLALVYAANAALGELYLSAVVVPLSYSAKGVPLSATLLDNVGFLLQSLTYSPFGITALTTLALVGYLRHLRQALQTNSAPATTQWAILALTFCALGLSLLRGGAAYPHYLLQLFPLLALGVAMMLKPGLGQLDQRLMRATVAVAIAAGLVANAPLSIAAAFSAANGSVARPLEAAAAAIGVDMRPGDKVWTLDRHLVSFYLDIPPIARFATHPDSIVTASIMQPLIEAGYAPPDLLGAMLAENARYVVTGPSGGVHYLSPADTIRVNEALAANYQPWLRNDNAVVYRRND